jgi:hypothetical protein
MVQAPELGRNGKMLVAKATGITEMTIWQGQSELNAEMADCAVERDRQAVVGRSSLSLHNPQTVQALKHVLESAAVVVFTATPSSGHCANEASGYTARACHLACPATASRLAHRTSAFQPAPAWQASFSAAST